MEERSIKFQSATEPHTMQLSVTFNWCDSILPGSTRLDPELVSKDGLSEFKLRDIMMGADRYLSSFL